MVYTPKLRIFTSLKIQTSVSESKSFRIESLSLALSADPFRSYQCETQAQNLLSVSLGLKVMSDFQSADSKF